MACLLLWGSLLRTTEEYPPCKYFQSMETPQSANFVSVALQVVRGSGEIKSQNR